MELGWQEIFLPLFGLNRMNPNCANVGNILNSQCQSMVCVCYLPRSSHGAGSSLFHTLDRPFSSLHQCSKLRFLQLSFLPMGEQVHVEMRTEKKKLCRGKTYFSSDNTLYLAAKVSSTQH